MRTDRQTDGRTERHDEANNSFSQFCEKLLLAQAPKPRLVAGGKPCGCEWGMPNANFIIAYSAEDRYRFSRHNVVIQAGMSEVRIADTYRQNEKALIRTQNSSQRVTIRW